MKKEIKKEKKKFPFQKQEQKGTLLERAEIRRSNNNTLEPRGGPMGFGFSAGFSTTGGGGALARTTQVLLREEEEEEEDR